MEKKKIIQDFTVGSIPKHLLLFSIPFVLSSMLQVVYSLIDMLIVGRFVGSFGLSAVSVSSMICNLATAIGMGFANGGQIYIAQLLGAGEQRKTGRAIGSLAFIEIVIGLAIGLICLLLSVPILRLLETPEESFVLARQYLLICGGCVVLTFLYNMISAVLRGMGDSRHPLWFVAIASVVNLVLDLLFTGYLGWGVVGAAWATVLGQAVSVLFSLVFLYRRREELGVDLSPESMRPDRHSLQTLLRVGIPFGLQSSAVNISMLFVTGMVNTVGVYASAVFGVGLKLDDIANKTGQGVMFALSTVVGQNFAKGEMGRVKQSVWYAWLYASVIYAAYGVALMLCNKTMFGWFTDDFHVIELAPVFAHALIWHMPALALMRGSNGLVRGVGNARLTLILSLLDAFVFRVGLCYLLGSVFHLGLFGFLLGYGLGTYGTAIPGTVYFFSGRWEKRKSLAK